MDHVEGLVVCDGVHEDITVDAYRMLGIEDCVLVLGTGERGGGGREDEQPTWPAVSMMSHSYSTPL